MSGSRWYVSLHHTRVSGDVFHVVLRQMERATLNPAELEADFEGREPLQQLLWIFPPYRMATPRAVAGRDGEMGFEMLEAPDGETEVSRARKVEQDLLSVKASAHYAAIAQDWDLTRRQFEAWRPQPGIRKALVIEKCTNPECGKKFVGFAELPGRIPLGYMGKLVHCDECGFAVAVVGP